MKHRVCSLCETDIGQLEIRVKILVNDGTDEGWATGKTVYCSYRCVRLAMTNREDWKAE